MRSISDAGDGLERLADAAGRRGVPEADLASMVSAATLAARGRAARRVRRRRALGVAALTLGFLGFGAGLAYQGEAARRGPSGRTAAPNEGSQRTGRDGEGEGGNGAPQGEATSPERVPSRRLGSVRVAGAGVVVEEGTEVFAEAIRSLRLERGQALFDVDRLEEGQRFEVRTPDLRVEVVGTVFAIAARAEGSTVHVYEGVVLVHREGEPSRRVEAGGYFRAPLAPESALDREGRRRAARREASARRESAGGVALGGGPVSEAGGVSGEGAHTASEREPSSPEPRERAPTLAQVRGWLAAGEIQRALTAAAEATRMRPRSGAWRMMLGDAQRIARDPGAADTYDAAAALLSESRSTQAGYLAAELRLRAGDAPGALRSLEASRATERGSPVAERAAVLELRCLERIGDTDALRRRARAYQLHFPAGAERVWVDGLLE